MNSSRFGLSEADLTAIRAVLAQFSDIERSILFGSRALGTYKINSDVDIAIVVRGGEPFQTLRDLSTQLNQELALPYKFDVLCYGPDLDASVKEHIDRFGVEL